MNGGLDKLNEEVEKVDERIGEIMVCNETIQKEENIIRLKNSDIQAHNSFITKLHEELHESQKEIDTNKTKLFESPLKHIVLKVLFLGNTPFASRM